MPWVDLGEVVGKDGEIGNVNSTYINNGGDPGVNIVRSGDDGAPDFTFEFENLANDPLSESELEQIVAGQTVNSASVVNGTVLSNFMSALGSVFAAIDHKHDASDIDSGTLAAERIANDSIGTEKFKPAVRDSLSLISVKKPEQLGKNELFGFVVAGINGEYVLTGFDDCLQCYSRHDQKTLWSTKQ